MIKGVIAGAFDVIHPGYVDMFNLASLQCDRLTVLLHQDPSIERPEKPKPILSSLERINILLALSTIGSVRTYNTEEDLYRILSSFKQINVITTYDVEEKLIFHLKKINPDIRFLGDDYKNKTYTGFELNIPIHYLDRSHGWSTTKFKRLIAESYEKSNNS